MEIEQQHLRQNSDKGHLLEFHLYVTSAKSAADLKAAGFTAAQLKAGGFTAKDLKDSGFSAADLNAASAISQKLSR